MNRSLVAVVFAVLALCVSISRFSYLRGHDAGYETGHIHGVEHPTFESVVRYLDTGSLGALLAADRLRIPDCGPEGYRLPLRVKATEKTWSLCRDERFDLIRAEH